MSWPYKIGNLWCGVNQIHLYRGCLPKLCPQRRCCYAQIENSMNLKIKDIAIFVEIVSIVFLENESVCQFSFAYGTVTNYWTNSASKICDPTVKNGI